MVQPAPSDVSIQEGLSRDNITLDAKLMGSGLEDIEWQAWSQDLDYESLFNMLSLWSDMRIHHQNYALLGNARTEPSHGSPNDKRDVQSGPENKNPYQQAMHSQHGDRLTDRKTLNKGKIYR